MTSERGIVGSFCCRKPFHHAERSEGSRRRSRFFAAMRVLGHEERSSQRKPSGGFRSRTGGPWFLAAAAIALLSGCSSLDWRAFGPETFGSDTGQPTSKEMAVQRFEERRTTIELLAAEAALDRGDYQECERALRAIVQRAPSNRDARLLLAESMALTGRRSEAFTQLEHALRDHPSDPRVHYVMALLLDASGRHDEAGQYYARAAELNPEFAQYNTEDVRGLCAAGASPPGEALASDGGFDSDGKDVYPVSATGSTTSPEQLLAESLSPARKDTVAPAPATVSTGLDGTSEPSFSPAVTNLFNQGRMALLHGEVESASVHFNAAFEADPHNPQIPVHAAIAALEQNYPEVAVALLKPAADRFPSSTRVHLTLGTAYYRLGDYSSSQVALRQALSLDNSNALAYVLMGCTLEKLGQPEAASAQWERAGTLSPRYRNLNR